MIPQDPEYEAFLKLPEPKFATKRQNRQAGIAKARVTIASMTKEERKAMEAAKMKTRMATKRKKFASAIAKDNAITRKQRKKEAKISAEIALFEARTRPLPNGEVTMPSKDLEQFFDTIGSRPDFEQVLDDNFSNPRVAHFLKLVAEKQLTLAQSAKACGISTTDFHKMWQDYKMKIASFAILDRMPEIATKQVDDALGARKSCKRCDGFGRVEVPESMREFFAGEPTAICPECEGKTYTIAEAKSQAVERIWERVGWAPKSSSVQVNVNVGDHGIDSVIGQFDDDKVIDI